MKKPTIYEIKRLTAETSPYFFNPKTMRFFKQTMKDFKVSRTEDPNRFLVSAKSFGGNKTQRVFNALTNELEHVTK